MSSFAGVHLPLVTPFKDGDIDFGSVRRLVEHYVATGVSSVILLGTTGESPTIEKSEQITLLEAAIEAVSARVPVYVGVSGNSTREMTKSLAAFEELDIAGYLMVTPYYNRPPQDGLVEHFRAVASATERPVIAYNVPYRTGVNLGNDSLLELAARVPNIRAVKDSTGDIAQSLDLLRRAPAHFSVLTGEDMLFFTNLAHGGAGGILASAHLSTETFVAVATCMARGDLVGGREAWNDVAPLTRALFRESNPMPLKHCLWRLGLIDSPECRLPLTRVSEAMGAELDAMLFGLDRSARLPS